LKIKRGPEEAGEGGGEREREREKEDPRNRTTSEIKEPSLAARILARGMKVRVAVSVIIFYR